MLTAKQPQSPFKAEAQFDKTALENSTSEKRLVKIIEKMCRIDGQKYESLSSPVKVIKRLSRRYGFEKIKISSALEETNKTKNNGKTIKIVIALLFVILVVAAGFIFTDKLPLLSFDNGGSVDIVGDDTRSSIFNGVINGTVIELEGFVERYVEKFGKMNVIFTGGDAIYFEKRVKFPNFADSNLLLVGLNKILNTNE